MTRYKTILLLAPWGKDNGVIRHVAHFAQAAQAEVVYVAHVAPAVDLSARGGHPEDVGLRRKYLMEQLQRLIGQCKQLFPSCTRLEPVVQEGSLAGEVARLAARTSADLVSMARGPQDADDAFSEAAVSILRKVPCSTLIVPAHAELAYGRVLVATDFSEASRDAVATAIAVASSVEQATMLIMHVYTVPGDWHTALRRDRVVREAQESARLAWDEISRNLDFGSTDHELVLREGQSVARTVLAAAEEFDAGLVVVGSHGYTRPAAAFLGHVADVVASRTRRAVLCVKKKGHMLGLLDAIKELYQSK